MDNNNLPIDEKYRLAELAKIKSETDINNAKRDEILRLANIPWYKSQSWVKIIIQAIIAGIVAVPLVWFYFKEVGLPLFYKDNIKFQLEIMLKEKKLHVLGDSLDVEKKRNLITKLKLDSTKQIMRLENERLLSDLFELKTRAKDEQKKLEQLLIAHSKQSYQLNLTQKERDSIKVVYSKIQKQLQESEFRTKKLDEKVAMAQERRQLLRLVSDVFYRNIFEEQVLTVNADMDTITFKIHYDSHKNDLIKQSLSDRIIISKSSNLYLQIYSPNNPSVKYYSSKGKIKKESSKEVIGGPAYKYSWISEIIFGVNIKVLDSGCWLKCKIIDSDNKFVMSEIICN